jgi:type VI protein secretion system component Hcp
MFVSQVLRHSRSLLTVAVAGAALAACGGEDVPDEGKASLPPVSTSANPLEQAGQLEFFVKIAGFQGESFQVDRRDFIPAIRFYANITKPDVGATRCSAVRFTKAAGPSDPVFLKFLSTGQTLPPVLMEFVRPAAPRPFVWQRINMTQMRVSRVEQAVSPPDNVSPSAVLEEVTLEPNNTATITLTSFKQNEDGTVGAAIETNFTCNR